MAAIHIGKLVQQTIKSRTDITIKAVASELNITSQGLQYLFTSDDWYLKKLIEVSKILGVDLVNKVIIEEDYQSFISEPSSDYNNPQAQILKDRNTELSEENTKLKDEILNLYREISTLRNRI